MPQNIDNLEIQIIANSTKASSAIDKLISSLEAMEDVVGKISTDKFAKIADGLNAISGAMTQMKSLDSRSFGAVARNLDKLSTINSVGLSKCFCRF